jgi:peptide deformylase
MSDILTINTSENTIQQQRIDPLPLFDDNHPMLSVSIPEYDINALPNGSMTNLISRLKMTMKLYGGIGLSANQCGILERVFVIGTDDFTIACINPKVITQSEEMIKDNEGCLSFPGMYLKLNRPKTIQVEFYDENGTLQRTTLDGLTARCYLHELDHMNGIKFTDHAGPVAVRLAKQRQTKMFKRIARSKK